MSRPTGATGGSPVAVGPARRGRMVGPARRGRARSPRPNGRARSPRQNGRARSPRPNGRARSPSGPLVAVASARRPYQAAATSAAAPAKGNADNSPARPPTTKSAALLPRPSCVPLAFAFGYLSALFGEAALLPLRPISSTKPRTPQRPCRTSWSRPSQAARARTSCCPCRRPSRSASRRRGRWSP